MSAYKRMPIALIKGLAMGAAICAALYLPLILNT